MNKKIIALSLIICCLFFLSCGTIERQINHTYTADIEWMKELDNFNERHKQIRDSSPEKPIEDYKYTYLKSEIGFTWEELEALTVSGNGKWKLSKDEAKEDTDILMRCFKYLYAGYQYYGGDDTFSNAFYNIEKEINRFSDTINQNELINLYRKHLGFIKDGHIYINDQPMHGEARIYYSDNCYYCDDKGFYQLEDVGRKYITSINGETNLQLFMKRTIDFEGRLAYRISIIDNTIKKEEAELLFDTNQMENIKLLYHTPKKVEGSSCTVNISENIAQVSITSFDDRRMNSSSRNEFLRSADIMAGSNLSILDLRGNGGGYGDFLNQWMINYDKKLKDTFKGKSVLYLDTIASEYFTILNEINAGADWFIDQKLWIVRNFSKNEWHINRYKFPEQMTKNDGILFVLMDKGTSSLSERLILSLLNKENVVLVGTPSGGKIQGDYGLFPIHLKNSGLEIRLPDSITFFYNDLIGTEGEGILPDIWSNGDSLESVKKMISFYNIK